MLLETEACVVHGENVRTSGVSFADDQTLVMLGRERQASFYVCEQLFWQWNVWDCFLTMHYLQQFFGISGVY